MYTYLHIWFTCTCDTLLLTSFLSAEKPNVLFIAVDDLRPELGALDQAEMVITPLDLTPFDNNRFCHPGQTYR